MYTDCPMVELDEPSTMNLDATIKGANESIIAPREIQYSFKLMLEDWFL